MNKYYIILIVLLCFGSLHSSFANEIQSHATDLAVEKRQFEKNLSEKYTDKQFDYTEDIGANQNIVKNILNWIFKKLGDNFNVQISKQTIQFFEILFYSLFIVFIIYLILRVLSNKTRFSLIKKESKTIENPEFDIQDILDTDYDQLIDEALKTEDFRSAIRYSYLKSLQILSKKNFISLNSKKTNSDYAKEIRNSSIANYFKKISYWYDHIWYGEYNLNPEDFEKANADFNQLENKVMYG